MAKQQLNIVKKRVIVKDRGYKKAIRNLKHNTRITKVAVGLLAKDSARSDGVSNVDLGYWQEYGTSKIPSRSFIRHPFDANFFEYKKLLADKGYWILRGLADVRTTLLLVGYKYRNDVLNTIRSGIEPPIKAATANRKGSTKPLIDTGQLVQSIDLELRR